jgi:hypothetical protein
MPQHWEFGRPVDREGGLREVGWTEKVEDQYSPLPPFGRLDVGILGGRWTGEDNRVDRKGQLWD